MRIKAVKRRYDIVRGSFYKVVLFLSTRNSRSNAIWNIEASEFVFHLSYIEASSVRILCVIL